ncbi:MAG: glycosyltransferase [Nostocaceae cyanobacterium]|nr:glycosyltransferase [Nostocaceae cyanobacterium]
MFELNYYNQSQLWRDRPEDYQVQLLADILSMIPVDTQSILDVGCGNGLITNALAESIYVVGIDSSEEALKNVNRKKHIGSILSLPFADNSFDLVMANDVIEHLPDDIYLKGVAELFRVASKYVLISVPHAEQLEKSFTKCAECNHVYHINHHQRSFSEQELVNLCASEWKVNEIRFSGDITRPPVDPLEPSLLHQLQGYCIYDNCLCPVCGSSKIIKNSSPKTQQILGNIRSKAFYNLECEQLINKHINRSEIIAFYRHNQTKEIYRTTYNNYNEFIEKSLSPLFVDFNNSLQRVKQGFVEGSFWSRFMVNNQMETSQNDLNNEQKQSFTVYFPVIPTSGDKIVVKTRVPVIDNPQINLLFHDELNNKTIIVDCYSYLGNGEFEFLVENPWEVNLYGAAVSIEITQEVKLESLQYISIQEKYNSKADFLVLNPGHNILFNFNLDYCRSWGLLAEESGCFPKPNWLWSNDLNHFYNLGYSKISLLDYKDSVEIILQQKETYIFNLLNLIEKKEIEEVATKMELKITNLSNLLEQKELQRSQAEQAYAKACNLLEQKELQRSQAEQAYAKASKLETFFLKNGQHRVSRVLVLSHMFPNQTQLNSGCFVAEQVKALRDFEGLDVRVVSCQPFWCNTKQPRKLANVISEYQKELKSINWSSYENIPILFIPYLVGPPFLPFQLHGFTYRFAVAKIADLIHKEFNFDLVHAHTGYLDGFAGLYMARKYQVPLVITEHTGPFSYLTDKPIVRHVTLKSLSSADRVICVSSSLKNEVKKWLPAFRHSKLICLPNGVDTTQFYTRENHNVSNNCLRLLSVISLDENKNPFCLMQAFQILRERGLQIELKIVGGGELIEDLKQWIVENKLVESIHILGWQPRNEVARLMREECDILVLPSRSETFSVVVIEALASGKPVVSTRCGGPESIITEPYLGELCENENPLALARAIEKVSKNLKNYPAYDIRQFAVENYSFERLAAQLNQLYQNV